MVDTPSTTTTGAGVRPSGRLVALMAAGLVDSFCLSVAWTVVVLEITLQHGLAAAALSSTAMLVGIALSAPTAGWLARRLTGRRLLRGAAGVEAALRLSVFGILLVDGSMWVLAACVAAMNVAAWTGYAGMRAEVAAVSHGAAGITWYGTVVAAVEALGVAVGALLPTDARGHTSETLLVLVAAVYVAALLPTVLVAAGSRVPRASPERRARPRTGTRSAPGLRDGLRDGFVVQGALLMLVASGPTLLAVALAAELHGRGAVGPAAVAFTLGSLAAPAVAARLDGKGRNRQVWWATLAIGMVAGWTLAPLSVGLLCLAQLASGLCMTTLEGLLDTRAARARPDEVTAALARSTAARALGSAGGTALLPLAVASAGLGLTAVAVSTALLLTAGVVRRFGDVRAAAPPAGSGGPTMAAVAPALSAPPSVRVAD